MNPIRHWTVSAVLLLVLGAGCGKINDSQKQAASNIIAGLAGASAGGMAQSTAALTAPGDRGAVTSQVGRLFKERVGGLLWLTRFKLESNPANLTLDPGLCATGNGTGGCTASCNGASTIYTIACTLPNGAGYSCDGTAYTFSDASLSLSLDFTNTVGAVGSATGSFDIGIAIAGDVSGGELGGDRLDCSM